MVFRKAQVTSNVRRLKFPLWKPSPLAFSLCAKSFCAACCLLARQWSCASRSGLLALWQGPGLPPDAAWARLDSGGTPCSVPKLSASLSLSVECASRMRAAPRSHFIGVAASGNARSGHARWPGQQAQGQRHLHQLWHVVSCGVAGGSQAHAPALTVRQPPNPSVNLTPCGSARLAFISF